MAKIATKTVDVDARTVTFDFSDGTQSIRELGKFPDDIQVRLALHGLSQVEGDAYSGAETVADAIALHNARHDSLMSGDWRRVGEGGGGGRTSELAVLMAMAAKAAGAPDEMHEPSHWQERVSGLTAKEKAGLRKDPAIAKAKADLERQRAKESAGNESSFASMLSATGTN